MDLTDDERERAVYGSDPAYDGQFVAAIRTSGISCRPSCRARRPFPEHVRLLADAAEARAAGYRACLRCHPDSARRSGCVRSTRPSAPMTLD